MPNNYYVAKKLAYRLSAEQMQEYNNKIIYLPKLGLILYHYQQTNVYKLYLILNIITI